MALAKANLGFPIQIAAGTTSAVYSVSSGKTAYIRSIMIYNQTVGTANTGLAQTVQVYMVPNSAGSTGTGSTRNMIGRINLSADDTFFFDLQYPMTLQSTNDSILVYNEGSTGTGGTTNTSPVTAVVLGDREA